MKNYFKYIMFSLVGLVLITSCEENVDVPDVPSQRLIFTSEQSVGNRINVNEDLTFGDISTGIESRTWTFPDGVVNIQNSANNTTSGESVVKAFFNSVGEYQVSLRQVFESDPFVNGQTSNRELDTTITVRVLEPVSLSVTANVINSDGTLGDPLNLADNARNDVLASGSVRFFVTTEGEPNTYAWEFEGGTPPTSEEAINEFDVVYRRVGTYDFSLGVSRRRPDGGDLVAFQNLVNVIPSTEPVTLDAVEERDGNIALVFSREMDDTTLDPGDFTVNLVNNGNTIANTIADATVDPDEQNVIILTLDNESVFTNDIATVSYTPGILATQDGVAASAFTDVPLVFVRENLLRTSPNFDHSFETAMNPNLADQGWGAPFDGFKAELSTAQAQDGERSVLLAFPAGGGMIARFNDDSGNLASFVPEPGQLYELGIWVFVESLGSTDTSIEGNFDPDLRFYRTQEIVFTPGPNPGFPQDFPVGEWVFSSEIVEFPAPGDNGLFIRGFNQFNPEEFRVFIDNISLVPANLRP